MHHFNKFFPTLLHRNLGQKNEESVILTPEYSLLWRLVLFSPCIERVVHRMWALIVIDMKVESKVVCTGRRLKPIKISFFFKWIDNLLGLRWPLHTNKPPQPFIKTLIILFEVYILNVFIYKIIYLINIFIFVYYLCFNCLSLWYSKGWGGLLL